MNRGADAAGRVPPCPEKSTFSPMTLARHPPSNFPIG